MRRAIALVSCAAVVACDSTSSGGLSSVTAEIGPEGGVLVAADGTRVDVPSGALPALARLTLEPKLGAQVPAGVTFLSTPWTLTPDWLEFAVPVRITFPIDRSRAGAGVVVLTTAKSTSGYAAKPTTGYLALAATPSDSTHVVAHSTRVSTCVAASANCPATCTTGADTGGVTLRCSSTCVGHDYLLSCNGATAAESWCSCIVDGVVAAAMHVDTKGGGAGEGIYTEHCGFPASSFAK